MALKIAATKSRVSEKAWGDVDKSTIWKRLKEALQNNEAGAKEAVKEMYAVVKAAVNAEVTQADCWGPHHEIVGDTLVLNRQGLFAAAQALASARAEPDLTPEQKKSAAKHLVRHYRELDLVAPESIRALAGEKPLPKGETVRLEVTVTGEMSVEEIPVSTAIDIQALKEGDNEPLEVVVEIPAGKSKRGWLYTPQALKRIADVVMEQGLPGFLGHQKPEDIDHEFPQPVTHWVGAKMIGEKAYIRGVVDPSAKDLKRWIKSKAVKTVSIYGIPTLEQVGGETEVVDFQPLSIDWTPLGRAGMDTRVVAVGEMDTIIAKGGTEMRVKEALEVIRQAIIDGNLSTKKIVGEIGVDRTEILEAVGITDYDSTKKIVGEITQLLNVENDKIIEEVKKLKEAADNYAKLEHEQRVNKVIGEMVKEGEEAKKVVKRFLDGKIKVGATDEEIKKAVGELVEQDEVVKQILNAFYNQPYLQTKLDDKGRVPGLVVKRVKI
ncbi:hypothetical protein TthWC1_1552 [Thermoanaerobacter thermohydrosulfuricus WC1]|uniref:Uncharacterized protein n=2 Tax=Thermoanaerobacter TaxID=1754 RepID=D3T346_THEIA|nr:MULTISPECIES: hypothetical protein [Thermoanaerobacter]ADD02648.1 hypothetical protein Thit_1389 [Thermoanaerobacter italicus Ab9]EMT38884.1 hypothetical protein TthWC1_1552 [Thermoanaerobacter thermohydrosulfuricus WC1]